MCPDGPSKPEKALTWPRTPQRSATRIVYSRIKPCRPVRLQTWLNGTLELTVLTQCLKRRREAQGKKCMPWLAAGQHLEERGKKSKRSKDKKTESPVFGCHHVFGSHGSDKEPTDLVPFLVIEQAKLSSPNRQQRFLT